MKRTFFFAILVAVLTLTACTPGSTNTQVLDKPLPSGTFDNDEPANVGGIVYVKGYSTIKVVPESFCETDCQEHDYVQFVVQEHNNKEFGEFLNTFENLFRAPDRIGLGCLEKDVIRYDNSSDKLGSKQFTTSKNLTRKIMNADQEHPTTLKLEMLPLTLGVGASECTSLFTYIDDYEQ